MGFFGFGKKKETEKQTATPDKYRTQLNDQLFRNLTQETAILLYRMKVVDQPAMQFLKDDRGILLGMFVQHTTDSRILAVRNTSMDTYLKVCGAHALGAGIYVTFMQDQLRKPVGQFTEDDVCRIAQAWQRTDPYELALQTLDITPQSTEKRSFDQIYLYGLEEYKKDVGYALNKDENIYTFMQVMFNAGETLGLRVSQGM